MNLIFDFTDGFQGNPVEFPPLHRRRLVADPHGQVGLKLEIESVKVHMVQGVKYKCSSVDVAQSG